MKENTIISAKTPIKLFVSLISFIFLFSPTVYADDVLSDWIKEHDDKAALCLLKERVLGIQKDGTYEETEHTTLLIQKEEAKEYGEIPIPYDSSFQEVKKIEAFVRNPEGKVSKPRAIQDINLYTGDPEYSNFRAKIISMPDVTVGSIIDWKTAILNKKPIIPNEFWESLKLSVPIPTAKLSCRLIVPSGMPLEFQKWNTKMEPTVSAIKDKKIYEWNKQFIDEVKYEGYMPPLDEIYEHVFVSSFNGWRQIDDWYWELTSKNLVISQALKDTANRITVNAKDDIEKIHIILRYVQEKFRYVSMSFDENRFAPHPADQVFENKYGDCKDQVIVAMAMLRVIGITSYPALFVEEGDGNPKDKLPMPTYFDHVILAIDLKGKLYYTDVLVKGYSIMETPPSLEGGYVFVINGKSGFFQQLPIYTEKDDQTFREMKVFIQEDGSAVVEETALWDKPSSVEFKNLWKKASEKEKREYLERLDEAYKNQNTVERRWEGTNSEFGQIKSYIKYKMLKWGEQSGDFISFGEGGHDSGMDFTSKKRVYPLVFPSNGYDVVTRTYKLPSNFQVVNLPKSVKVQTPMLDYSIDYEQKGQEVIERIVRRNKRTRIPASRYQETQKWDRQLTELSSNKIVIKRIAH